MRGRPAHAGDLLTLGRLLVTPVYVWSFRRALDDPTTGGLPALLFVFACVSDIADGPMARRAARASARGALLDGIADIVFLLAALGAAWAAGLAPWWVPGVIALSFATYLADSWWRTGGGEVRLVASRIGHWGGVCNYVLVGVLTFNDACGLRVLGVRELGILFALVPLYSIAGMVARLTPRRSRRA